MKNKPLFVLKILNKSPKAKLIPQQEKKNRQSEAKIQSFDFQSFYIKKQGKSHLPSEEYESDKRDKKRELPSL